MTRPITVSLDAMGGDAAPDIVVEGAAIAAERLPEIDIVLHGPLKALERSLSGLRSPTGCMRISEARNRLSPDIRPALAFRQGRGSSMWCAIDMIRHGKASCAVSAGETGALMMIARFLLKTMTNISRPAMCGFIPTRRGDTALLDLGANLRCKAENLIEFAVMGEVYARIALGIACPSVGLLNVGQEDMKGNEALRRAHEFLSNAHLPMDFKGFVEGDAIPEGLVDVVVTDGFSGNVALKAVEGTSRVVTDFVRGAFLHSIPARLGYLLASHTMKRLTARVDPRRHNGAMFLGINGIVVKSHGGTDGFGFANAIEVAVNLAKQGMLDRLQEDIQSLYAQGSILKRSRAASS